MFYSTYPSVDIPRQNLVTAVLREDSSYNQEKPIFIDANDVQRNYSMSSLRKDAKAFGAGLQVHHNFQAGDVVAIFSANSIEYPMVVFGTFFATGTVTLINPVYRSQEVAHQLRDSQAKVLYTTNELLATALAACELVGLPLSSVIVAEAKHGMFSLQTMLETLAADTVCLAEPDSLAFLCYSSGTTGLSKGVRLSHLNLVSNLYQWDAGESKLDAKDSLISVLPFSHIYALNVLIMNPLRRMMTSYVMSRFVPQKFLELVQEHRITASFIVPPIVKALLSPAAKDYDLSSLDFLCCGAAPLAPAMAQELCTRYKLMISQGFGLTETSPVLCYGRFDGARYNGSVGKLLPEIELRIVSEDGCEQGVNGHGELQVRGPNIMQGYLNNSAADANAFTVDGFFKTGDLGYVAEDGCVYLVDRIKELIKYKGFQVPPVELENVLLTHPKVLDCAVIGRESEEEVTELPTAYCVLKPDALRSDERKTLPAGWQDVGEDQEAKLSLARELIEFVASKVANYKKLRGGVVFTDSIPRVPAGKILRRNLKELRGVQFLI